MENNMVFASTQGTSWYIEYVYDSVIVVVFTIKALIKGQRRAWRDEVAKDCLTTSYLDTE